MNQYPCTEHGAEEAESRGGAMLATEDCGKTARRSKFYVLSIGHKAIVLGHTWLVEHNPDFNWHTGEVKLT